MTEYDELRARMVDEQLASRGISDPRVLEAMEAVPRELFVRDQDRELAYIDAALGIEEGQTISQPWIVAAICQALELGPTDEVLEIGTGSGYSTAVIARLADSVLSIERLGRLTDSARARLESLGVENAVLRTGDGSVGAEEAGPFDAIAVHAAAPKPPPALLAQLAPGGRLVVPIASGAHEDLTLYRRRPDREGTGPEAFERTGIALCRFVPLLGREGYPE